MCQGQEMKALFIQWTDHSRNYAWLTNLRNVKTGKLLPDWQNERGILNSMYYGVCNLHTWLLMQRNQIPISILCDS